MFNPVDSRNLTTRFGAHWASADAWQVYTVPRGAVALYMIAVGGGGGGGAGFGAAAGTARGGGGGGGSGAVSRLWIPTIYLPKQLYVIVGVGGDPGTAGTPSRVSVDRGTVAASQVLQANNGAGGGNGTATAAGSGGAAGTVVTATSAVFQNYGTPVWLAGQAGANGGVHTGAVGGSVTWGAIGIPVSGGAGGAGCTATEFAGGNITGAGIVPTLSGGALGANPGQAGRNNEYPLYGTGGSGAGSSNSVAGAVGGDGAPGCGGGGGGAGVTTGGSGGRGGNGFVIITALFG